VNIGARFDDRCTGRLDAFSPNSRKIHVDIDPSSINKIVRVEVPIVGDCGNVLEAILAAVKPRVAEIDKAARATWWERIGEWRASKSLAYQHSETTIKPQYAVERLFQLSRGRKVFITTEVGQHQMWAAQHFHFDEPNRWMTSG